MSLFAHHSLPRLTRRRAVLAAVGLVAGAQGAIAQNCTVTGLDRETFERVIHERFSALLGPSSSGVPGSYASLDIKDAEATFASTIVPKTGPLIGIKAHGGTADGILSAISNQSVSPKFGADVQLHFLRDTGQVVQFETLSCEAYYAAIAKSEDDYALRKVEIDANYRTVLQASEVAALDKKLGDLAKAIDDAAVPSRRDSLRVELLKAMELKRQVMNRKVPTQSAQRQASNDQRSAELRKARDLLKVVGFTVGWWSVGYGVENAAFRLFDPSQPLGAQLTKRSYVSHGGSLIYSHYALGAFPGETRFWSVSGRLSWENNLGSLTKLDLTDRTTYGSTPNERVAEKKFAAYQGAYAQDRKAFRLGGDYYRFILDGDQGAVHLFPAITVKDGTRAAYAMGVGYLLTARKGADSYLNAELYYNLTDLTDSQDSGQKIWGRSDLGLRFTFPIAFYPRI
jgi:hypothetical protein